MRKILALAGLLLCFAISPAFADSFTGPMIANQATGPGHCWIFELNVGTTQAPVYFVGTMWSGDAAFFDNYNAGLIYGVQGASGVPVTAVTGQEPTHTDGTGNCAGQMSNGASVASVYIAKLILGTFK